MLYNTLSPGLIWASAVCIQGALLNPIQSLSSNSFFYMLGIALYCALLSHLIYLLFHSFLGYFYRLRALLKLSLLAVANISSVYIFTTAFLLDLVCIGLEYYSTKRYMRTGKIWAVRHVLLDLALGLLVLMPSSFLALVLASLFVLAVLILDIVVVCK